MERGSAMESKVAGYMNYHPTWAALHSAANGEKGLGRDRSLRSRTGGEEMNRPTTPQDASRPAAKR